MIGIEQTENLLILARDAALIALVLQNLAGEETICTSRFVDLLDL